MSRWKGNQRGRLIISTGIDGTARHGTWPKSARLIRVNTFATRGAAGGEHGLARTHHVRRVRVVADQLEGVVGLDGAAYVERSAGEERPAAVIGLTGADVGAETRLGLVIDLVEKMVEKDVLGRDGRVGLELEEPVAVVMLEAAQAGGGVLDDLLDVGSGNGAVLTVRRLADEGFTPPVWPGARNLHGRQARCGRVAELLPSAPSAVSTISRAVSPASSYMPAGVPWATKRSGSSIGRILRPPSR